MRQIVVSLVILVFISTNAHAQRGRGGVAAPADGGPNGLGALHFRPLGPEGNRVASITGVPGDAMTVYVGAADGGIWKTTDAGITWRPLFDDKDVSAVGALAVAPSAHDTVWAGTGEPWLIRPYYTLGDGVYKSTDAGRTWQHMSLDATGHIARIVIDPANANSVYVCANAASSTRLTAARPGSRSSPWTRTPAARISRWIRAIRKRCTPACGS
jgi:hypothetical protein